MRERGEAFVARRLHGKAIAFDVRLPRRARPLFELRVEAQAEPEAQGDRVRLVAHTRLNLPQRRLDTWVEVRASNAALDEGSRALVPEKLQSLGIEPQRGKPFQTWAGGLQGARPGFAMLSLLQLDKDTLPAPLQDALGDRPFQLTATLVNVIEEVA